MKRGRPDAETRLRAEALQRAGTERIYSFTASPDLRVTVSRYHLISLSAFFNRERHLTSIVPEKKNDGSEKERQDEIDGTRDCRI